MSYDAYEESRHAGQPVTLFKFEIPAREVETLVASDDFEYADTSALLAAWPLTDPGSFADVSLDTANPARGSKSAKFEIASGQEVDGDLYISRTYPGLTPSAAHRLRVQCWLNADNYAPANFIGMRVGDDIAAMPPIGTIERYLQLSLDATSSAGGEIEPQLGFFDLIAPSSEHVFHFDWLRVYELSTLPATVYAYTSDGLSHSFRGDTYQPSIISHGPIEWGSGETGGGEVEITVPRDHEIALLVRGGLPITPIRGTIYLVHRPDIAAGTSYVTPFVGQITKPRIRGASCVFTLASARSLLDRKRPSLRCQKVCNWMLYDERCGLNKADFAYTSGTVTAIDGKIVTISGLAAAAASDATKFQFGYLVSESGESCFIESQVVDPDTGAATDQVGLLAYPRSLEVGQSVTVHWGCDRTTGATGCRRFGNIRRYGGFPKMTARNPYIGAGIQS